MDLVLRVWPLLPRRRHPVIPINVPLDLRITTGTLPAKVKRRISVVVMLYLGVLVNQSLVHVWQPDHMPAAYTFNFFLVNLYNFWSLESY